MSGNRDKKKKKFPKLRTYVRNRMTCCSNIAPLLKQNDSEATNPDEQAEIRKYYYARVFTIEDIQ